jgi:anti-sigma factor RsiW
MNCETITEWRPLFLSGELGAASAKAFNEHIQTCETCAAELERQVRLDALLREAVSSEEIDTSALDQRVRRQIASRRRLVSMRWAALAATIAALLLIAALGSRHWAAPATPQICADAATDHLKEVTQGKPRKWLSDARAITELAERNGVPGSTVVALAPAGYHLDRGKLCRLDGRVFLHLVFAGEGREFSTFLRRESKPGRPLLAADSGLEHVAFLQTGQFTAVVVSEQSSQAALSHARFVAGVL